jgi:dipeptidyl-peptidase 4
MKFSILVACLITFVCISFSQEDLSKLTVERIWKKYEFGSKGFPGFNGMKDGKHFTKLNINANGFESISKHSYENYKGQGEILVSASDLVLNGQKIAVDDYAFNADESMMLILSNQQSIYRRSFLANYYIFDLKTKKLSILDEKRNDCTLAEFSPNGAFVAYIFENNLFVKELKTNKITQLTKDGKRNHIINGTTDWVYEEEFSITKGFEWSPDSKFISYLKFDESKVKEFTMTYYGQLYPDLYTWKYPKAGEDNSKVKAYVVDVAKNQHLEIQMGDYEYIPRLQWSTTKNQLILLTLNRHQNQLKYHLYDASQKGNTTRVFFEEMSKTYVEVDDNLLILNDGSSLLRTSEMSGFNHIYQVSFDGKNTQITQGNWDVIDFLGIDEAKQIVYYTSAEKGAIHKGIYAIQLDGKNKKSLSNETGYNHAIFAEGMSYFVRISSDANTPNTFTLCDAEGKEIAVLQDNASLKSKLETLTIAKKEFFEIQGVESKLNAWMIKPANFDPTKKYPVYFFVYSGPGHNTVLNKFDGNDYMYHQLLAQQGYIVVSVDPRGTMYRGQDFKKSTYLQLGKYEIEDITAAAKEMMKLPYVDASRIGIQGWSYGGFMSSLAMTKSPDVFKMGIAVAPVTNWRYYDNIYTERFMRTPQENASGYDDNSPINFVKNIKGNYFLIHGSGDDNVHYQNAMEMITSLVNANVQFDLFIYPNKDHGIYGGNTRNHLFNMLFDYTLRKL